MKMIDMLKACIANAEKELATLQPEDQKKIQKLQKNIAQAKKHIKLLETA